MTLSDEISSKVAIQERAVTVSRSETSWKSRRPMICRVINQCGMRTREVVRGLLPRRLTMVDEVVVVAAGR